MDKDIKCNSVVTKLEYHGIEATVVQDEYIEIFDGEDTERFYYKDEVSSYIKRLQNKIHLVEELVEANKDIFLKNEASRTQKEMERIRF